MTNNIYESFIYREQIFNEESKFHIQVAKGYTYITITYFHDHLSTYLASVDMVYNQSKKCRRLLCDQSKELLNGIMINVETFIM